MRTTTFYDCSRTAGSPTSSPATPTTPVEPTSSSVKPHTLSGNAVAVLAERVRFMAMFTTPAHVTSEQPA